MIRKVKELMQVKENIDSLTEHIKKLEGAINSNREQTKEVRNDFREISKENKQFLTQIKKDIDSFVSCRKQMEKELYDFKLFKKEVKKEMIAKAEKDINEIKANMKKEVNEFNELKRTLNSRTSDLDILDSQIMKLIDITKKINAKDFELTRHMKNIEKADKEKLDLMRKIDSLQRLVATQRRRR